MIKGNVQDYEQQTKKIFQSMKKNKSSLFWVEGEYGLSHLTVNQTRLGLMQVRLLLCPHVLLILIYIQEMCLMYQYQDTLQP